MIDYSAVSCELSLEWLTGISTLHHTLSTIGSGPLSLLYVRFRSWVYSLVTETLRTRRMEDKNILFQS